MNCQREKRFSTRLVRFCVTTLVTLIWAFSGWSATTSFAQTTARLDSDAWHEVSAPTAHDDNTLQIRSNQPADRQGEDAIEFGLRVLEHFEEEQDSQVGDLATYQHDAREAESRTADRGHWNADGTFQSDKMRALGISVEDDWNGGTVGILITKVVPGSPAAAAGLRGRDTGAMYAVLGSLFLAPQEGKDLIVGVEGVRTPDVMMLEDEIEKSGPGETVYFSVIRGCRRLQIPVSLPASRQQP
jgi:hypothetical protein